MVDDYEMISHREMRKLKEDLNRLKQGHPVSSDMKSSIRELNDKLSSLIEIFDSAVEDLRGEDRESELISDKINPMLQKLEDIDEQNKKLAQGMVAINALVDDKLSELNKLVESLRHTQDDMEEKIQNLLHEVKGNGNSMSHGLPPLRSDTDLKSSLGSSSMGGLPPLPGSRHDKKKFKLF